MADPVSAPARRRVGILVSGRGSNMAALIAAAAGTGFPAEIACVVSNRPGAGALERAAEAGIATDVVDHRAYPDRESFEIALDAVLVARGVELICLAGFMRLLTPWFVTRWQDRMINIHPSILPAFKGLHTHERALETGVRLHGCTVHFVRAEMDDGPIIAQAAVPVIDGDDPDTLAARVLQAEHRLYPLALALVAGGHARVEDGHVRLDRPLDPPPAFVWPER